ncbi:Stk1 family PASTA domain-containing Ser/Thr kinase [Staphylococcus massiliensis]|uniref:Stk1 family PASTA domain-containing Ser/Thr kinase n=1 Tax=Staphylococcus massiliensis TaxID=555791 RepID=UPI000CD15C50|nr:Stk1 family PASTA domain-containing Ser/Thr kinase [Staphylococcus massiliensis]MCG3398811.1 Stk1 family PASTA domain-containing Ser/Thr kinase [Staphylococcus massiliensis]POA00506.1 serine/threonine protein kinase [Staphylococcus massiliensis CCUG 55927]
MIGMIINERYELIEYLGGGGMSNVYVAIDKIFNRKVAVKIINIPPNEKTITVKRFEREVQNTTLLANKNVVNVLDVDEDENTFYLVMEYIEGPTLADYIRTRGPLSVETAIQFTKQIINGIKHAHHHKIIHRDIKPHNILIDANKTLKIVDFGIAKAMSETQMTETNHVVGTVQYISPEQAKGEPADECADIYSIGIVLYEMLMAEPPFVGETPVSVAIKHIREQMPNATDKRRNVPQALSNVILKATEKDARKRYQNVQEMYDDLDTALDESRKHEAPYMITEDTSETIKIPKNQIHQNQNNHQSIDQTVEIPIVESSKSKSEPRVYPNTYKKKSRHKKWLYALIFFLLLISLIGFIAIAMFGDKYSDVPNILGKTEKQAESMLKKKKLKIGKISRDYSDKYQENEVMAVTPNVGERAEQDGKVDIVLSKGPKTATMPNLIGKSKQDAERDLKNLGVKGIKYEQAYTKNNIPKGAIENQSVQAGSTIQVNKAQVVLTESLGVEQVYVDDYEGKPFKTAKKELEAKGLKVVVEKRRNDSSVKKDHVISHTPKDQNVNVGQEIRFIVSSGKDGESDEEDTTEDDEENLATKRYHETFSIPYSGRNNKSQKVEVILRDKNNDGTTASETFTIKRNKMHTIRMEVEEGQTAGFTVRVDGKVVKDKDISYDSI